MILKYNNATEEKLPDVYLLDHTPDVVQKNIRLYLEFLTLRPSIHVQLKVLCTAGNHQREQNCHLLCLREKVVERSVFKKNKTKNS